MIFRRNKNQVSEEPVVAQGSSAYEIGLNGTVADFDAAVQRAREVIAVKKAPYDKSLVKYRKRDIFDGHKKHAENRKAYVAAKNILAKIREEFFRGACDAFLESPSRPDNLQHIMSHPEKFITGDTSENRFVISTLLNLLDKSDATDAALESALAEVGDKRQDILDRTLMSLVCNYRDVESRMSILLKGGAKGTDGLSVVLAHALHRELPDAVSGMLIAEGATIDGALERMRAHPKYYGDTPKKVADFEYRKATNARIHDLECRLAEATKDITEKKPGEPEAAPPAPAARTATRLKVTPTARPQ